MDSAAHLNTFGIFDWTGSFSDMFPFEGQAALITNGADGVGLSWWDQHGSGAPVSHWTAITSGGISDSNGPAVADMNQVPIAPILQRGDGSFIGLAMTGDRFASFDQLVPYMVALDAGGGVLWSVANETPKIATVDGGVIGASGITYDTNGSAAGQIGLPTVSWQGNVYVLASIDQLAALPFYFAASFAPFQGANQSQNRTSFPRDSKANQAVKDKLSNAFWRTFAGSHCAAVLGNTLGMPTLTANYSLRGVQDKQRIMNFYDVGNPNVGEWTVAQVTGRQLNLATPLLVRLGNNNAVTDNGGYSKQTAVILKAGILSGAKPEFLLVHELVFHAFPGLTDDQVFGNSYFQSQGLWRASGSTATTGISDWLSTDCRCTPGNPQATNCQPNTATW